jgi:hypothetical protein
VRAGGAARAAATGLCWGLCWVLKPEFILAGAGVLVGALLLRRARGSAVGPTEIVSGLSCTLAPTLLFAAGLSQSGGFAEGWHHATTAWRVVVTGAAVDPAIQASFSGWDDPWRNLARHGRNTGIALLLLAGTTLLAARLDRVSRVWPRVAGAVLPAALLLVFLRQPGVADEAGAALLGLLAGRLLAFRWPVPAREASPEGRLLTVAAAGMMARMMLNGRLDHFGFYQAALAVMVLVAVLWAEWPALLPRERRWGRGALQAAAAAIVLGLVGVGWNTSRAEWAQRTYAVGEGPDRFLVRPPPRAHGVWLNYALAVLEQEKATGSLLVLPEGLMLNYLARMPSPVAPFFLFSFATRGEAEARLVAQLERRPPQWVVVLARDLREYGIERYGERPGEGALLVAWVDRHYELVAAAAGRHPLKDPAGDVWVMRRKPGPG